MFLIKQRCDKRIWNERVCWTCIVFMPFVFSYFVVLFKPDMFEECKLSFILVMQGELHRRRVIPQDNESSYSYKSSIIALNIMEPLSRYKDAQFQARLLPEERRGFKHYICIIMLCFRIQNGTLSPKHTFTFRSITCTMKSLWRL